jgi:hypothetical protein
VREVVGDKVSVVQRGVKGPEVARSYSKAAFLERWMLLSGLTTGEQEKQATATVVCGTCSRRRRFFAPTWAGVRCDGCGDLLPDFPMDQP